MEKVEDGVGETEVLEVEQTLLFYSREHWNYLQEPQCTHLLHTVVME